MAPWNGPNDAAIYTRTDHMFVYTGSGTACTVSYGAGFGVKAATRAWHRTVPTVPCRAGSGVKEP